MPERSRFGKPSGPTVVGVVIATVLVVGLVVTGRLLSVPGAATSVQPTPTTTIAAPYRIGDRLVCPLGHPVLATASGRSYPPGHPTRPPPEARPVACYDTADQATLAGYPPAPLPPGGIDLDGEYLVPTSSQLHRQCRRAASRVGFAVPCPRLLPALAPNTMPPALCDLPSTPSCTPVSGFLLEVGGFTVPSDRIVAYQDFGEDLAIAASKRPAAVVVSCPGERPIAPARVRESDGRLYRCPPRSGLHGDSILLRWEEEATILVVSVSGDSELHQRLVVTLANHLELVPPGK
ncbi:MAG TPA: hypothetical protein VE776_15470 [Actinomycetota bacterium]|jgi:hypothetical protein|nr:hypothetical protein [Actinomycetota bacterium]